MGCLRIRSFDSLSWAFVLMGVISNYPEWWRDVMIILVPMTWIDGDLCMSIGGEFPKDSFLSFLFESPLFGS